MSTAKRDWTPHAACGNPMPTPGYVFLGTNEDKIMSDLINMDADEVKAALAAGTITLVDVREANEFAARRIAGSINLPLSTFDPADVPKSDGKEIVFMCAGGVRSAKAVTAVQSAGLPWNKHLSGGINAWVQAGHTTQ